MELEERNKGIAARWFDEYWNNANTRVPSRILRTFPTAS